MAWSFRHLVRRKPNSLAGSGNRLREFALVAGGRLSFLILSSSPLLRPSWVVGVLMAGSRKRPLPSWKLPRGPRRHLPKRARALRLAWVLFIVIGAPLGFMAALGPMAYAGIYIEPLRQFWQPWPPDILKSIAGGPGVRATPPSPME